jgi:uncharacterized surface protein with fasciclin (FAS1) repeats
MKNTKLFLLGVLTLGLFTFSSCGEDDDPQMGVEPDIVELAQGIDELSTLVAALQQVNLVSTLQGDGPFTVFAPTNAAFQALLDSNDDWNSLEDIDDATLTSVLLFHVLGAKVNAKDLENSYVTTASTGPNDEQIVLQIDVDGGVTFNGTTMPIQTDVAASNGVVHTVDEVMLPPNVVDLALNNPQFSILVQALTRADLTTDYVSVLTGTGPFTVFAPTNAAFEALLASNMDWNSLDDIPVETLEAVLNYHVVNGGNVQADELVDGAPVTTLGGELTVNLTDGAKLETSSGQTVNIIITDVQGANGVVHAVDTVLLP